MDIDLVFDLSCVGHLLFLCLDWKENPAHIFLVDQDEVVLDQHRDFKLRIVLFRDQIPPLETGVGDVDRDNLLPRCALVRDQVEEGTVISDALCQKIKVRKLNKPRSPSEEKNEHGITGVEFVHDLEPF